LLGTLLNISTKIHNHILLILHLQPYLSQLLVFYLQIHLVIIQQLVLLVIIQHPFVKVIYLYQFRKQMHLFHDQIYFLQQMLLNQHWNWSNLSYHCVLDNVYLFQQIDINWMLNSDCNHPNLMNLLHLSI
jgi:hypothetical protein